MHYILNYIFHILIKTEIKYYSCVSHNFMLWKSMIAVSNLEYFISNAKIIKKFVMLRNDVMFVRALNALHC